MSLVQPTLARLLAAALAISVFLVGFDIIYGRFFYRDIDDILRGIQIRQFLDYGGWYDLTIRGIDMPGPYVSPWSRLIDLPYVAIARVLQLALAPEDAIAWAFRLWQPVLLLAFCLLWIGSVLNLSRPRVEIEPLHIVAAFALMPLTLWEFTPGRIDHHNVQIVMLMVAVYGISCWSYSGGLIAGLGVVLSFLVGLELAPVLAVLLLGPCLAFVFGVKGGRRLLAGLATSAIVVSLLAGLIFLGPHRMMATECDAFSAPYISALLGFSVVILPAALFLGRAGRWARLIYLAVAAMLLIGALALVFPSCLAGPYAFIEPMVRSLWLDRVQQERSVLDFYREGEFIKVACIAGLAVVALAVLPSMRRQMRAAHAPFVIVFATGVALLLLTLIQTRFMRFPAALVLLVLPTVWSGVKERWPGARTALVASAGGCLVCVVSLWLAVPQRKPVLELLDYMTVDLCTNIDPSPLRGLPPGRIVAPSSLGLFLLDRLPPGMTINSISFHRAAPGMRAMFDVFLSMDSETRKRAAAPFDYLAVCRYDVAPYIENDTLFARLMRGGEWPGLTLIHDGPPGSPRFFRIDHARFE
ncbi:hypothetical protein [Rhizobium sp. SL86]|uniref:hypothetical protein n=1 Tax=Rhizobium sp. SL86 TaxID=2995148 RepID=UPI002275B198|nr:hypothetical protein [Rhizobium sp. SL86]MCY1669262.1 hypothetical protein [Rhizobium sp. SL86]